MAHIQSRPALVVCVVPTPRPGIASPRPHAPLAHCRRLHPGLAVFSGFGASVLALARYQVMQGMDG
jgi:hypothetical protein